MVWFVRLGGVVLNQKIGVQTTGPGRNGMCTVIEREHNGILEADRPRARK